MGRPGNMASLVKLHWVSLLADILMSILSNILTDILMNILAIYMYYTG